LVARELSENFAPPEIHKEENASFKSDVWSLGCLLYFMATKIEPWDKKSRI
jgi:serine/threonine protein kinase